MFGGEKMRKAALAAVITAVVLMLSGCGENAYRKDKEIKVGLLLSQQAVTEQASELLWGIETAEEDLERKYGQQGYTITTEVFDDGGKKGEAAHQAEKILEREDIDFVFVLSRDEELEKAAKKLEKGKKITFWLDEEGEAVRQKGGKYQFANLYSLQAQAETVINHLQGGGIKNLAVVYTPVGFSYQEYLALRQAAEQNGITICAELELAQRTPDDAVKTVRESGAQAVAVLAGNTTKNVDLVRAVRKLMPEAVVLSDHTVDQTETLKTDARALEGTLIPCGIKTQWEAAELNSVIQRYEAVYKDTTQVGRVSHGYFSLSAVADGTVECGTADPRTLEKYFRSPSSARYQFGEDGTLIYDSIPILQAKNGVFEILIRED